VRNLGESCRLPPNLPQSGDPNYVLGPWDIEDLQGAVDGLARGEVVADQHRHDVLLQVGVRGQDVRLPRAGVAFTCEACGNDGRVHGQSGPRIIPVQWVWFADSEHAEIAMRAVSTDVGDRLYVEPYGDGWAGYRLLVVCASCARSHRGKRGLQRCWHEEPSDDAGGQWWRCQEVVVSRDFCGLHASRSARHRRDTAVARRASAQVPRLGADATPAELLTGLWGAAPELLALAREIRDVKAGNASLESLQRKLARAANRIADA